MCHSTGQYQLGWRYNHTVAVVGEVLYCWGGDQQGLPHVYDSDPRSDLKRGYTCTVDTLNLLSGSWSCQITTGTPPLGVKGVSCTTNINNIYYFGGYCHHDNCFHFHNSLNCLDTLTLQWRELQSTGNNSVNKRGYSGMMLMESEDKPQLLLVIGGQIPLSTITLFHHQFQYIKLPGEDDHALTNEQNIYNLSTGKSFIQLQVVLLQAF